MKNMLFYIICFALVITSCGEKNGPTENFVEESKPSKKLSLDDRAKRYIEDKLGINAAEEYHFESYRASITADTIVDGVFVVQRKAYAQKKVEDKGLEHSFRSNGFTAPENYLFVYDAAKDKFVSTLPIAANIKEDLKIEFIEFTTPAKNDISLVYHLSDGAFISFYSYANEQLLQILNFPLYSDLGGENEVAYTYEFAPGSASLAKDVFIYKAELEYEKSKDFDPFTFEPKRIKTDELYLQFLFDPKRFKYVTPGFE